MNKNKSKGKKMLYTTLGKAPVSTGAAQGKSIDMSHLRKPIETSLFGLRQVLGLFDTATEEVKNYICYECDLIYECRVCRTIFRSLANFILHKREYCKEKHRDMQKSRNENHIIFKKSVNTKSQSVSPVRLPRPVDAEKSPMKHLKTRNLSEVLSKLKGKHKSEQICREALEKDLVEEMEDANNSENESVSKNGNSIALQEIGDSVPGTFQTVMNDMEQDVEKSDEELMRSEVMEIHSILNNDEVILGSDGKIFSRPIKPLKTVKTPEFNLTCNICKQNFSTKKTLTYHMKYKHNKTKVVYLCPENGCRGHVFANTWSVFRHLYKVHRKTNMQIKKMRSQIQTSVIRRGQLVENTDKMLRSNSPKTVQETQNQQNIQWMDTMEGDNELQMCGGCGKRFERKAALNSHFLLCQKRLAMCNSMKEDKKPEEDVSKPEKQKQEIPKLVIKNQKIVGSQKRKSRILRKVYRSPSRNNSTETDNNTKALILNISAENKEASKELVYTVTTETAISNKHIPPVVADKNSEVIDSVSDVIIVNTIDVKSNISKAVTVLKPEILNVESTPIDIVYLSDDEMLETPPVTLQTKAGAYMDIDERRCLPCECVFSTIQNLLRHMATHFKWFHYQCNECLFKSYDKTNLETHLQNYHSITDYENHIVHLSRQDVLKNSVEFQPLFVRSESVKKQKSDVATDPSIQKMIMEVIFGNISNISEANHQRPVRNRVMPKKDDFVYENELKKITSVRPFKVYSKKKRLLEDITEKT